MKPTAYIETTIPSYLMAWPSRDVVRAGEQQVTRDWWDRRAEYELRVSSLVLLECQAGDAKAAADRLAALEGVLVLVQTPEAEALAGMLLKEVPLPPKAANERAGTCTAALESLTEIKKVFQKRFLTVLVVVSAMVGRMPIVVIIPAVLLPTRFGLAAFVGIVVFFGKSGLRAFDDFIQFAPVQPDSPASRTVINFDTLAVGHQQLNIAFWTFHKKGN